MKKIKKIAAIATIACTALALSACGSKGTKTDDATAQGDTKYEKIVYAYASFNNIPSSDTLDTVEEELNKITRDKIGAEIELMPIAISDYSSSVSLALQGGDQIDLFESLGDFNNAVSSSMAYDLTDIVDDHASDAKRIVGDDLLAACEQNGRLYGIPTYKPYAITPMIIYKQDIADELGIDMSKVTSLSDLTDVLKKVKDAHPDMTPVIPMLQGNTGVIFTVPNVDFLSDDGYSPKGVMMNDDKTVVDFYGTKEFSDICSLVRSWYEDGLILKDAATTTSTATELMASPNSFCYVAAYSYPPEDTAASLESQVGGQNLGAVQIGDAYLSTGSVNAVSWMVSSTSKVPEKALEFLNLTYSDPSVTNLLIYGIEGRDYVLADDGYVSYPEGQDSTTVPYTAQLSCGTLGNYFIMYPMAGTNRDSLVWEEEQNRKAKKSTAMGFAFDYSNTKTEYTAVSNVIQQYLPGLICGSVDPDTVLPEFIDKLKTAGLDTIIAEKQKQLDEWSNNK